MKKRKFSKKACEKYHAKKQFKKRFGIFLNRYDIKNIIDNIQNGKYEFIENQTNRVNVWKGVVKGKEAVIIYDKHRKMVITFLTPAMLNSVEYRELKEIKDIGRIKWIK